MVKLLSVAALVKKEWVLASAAHMLKKKKERMGNLLIGRRNQHQGLAIWSHSILSL